MSRSALPGTRNMRLEGKAGSLERVILQQSLPLELNGAIATCGRYGRRSDKQKIAEHFRAKPSLAELPMPDADCNIAPITHQPIIR